jgi:hypothetical protein
MNIEQEAIRLRQLWAVLFREFDSDTPNLTQFYVWLGKYPPIVIEQAIQATLKSAFYMSKQKKVMGFEFQVNYAEKVMKNKTRDQMVAEYKEFGLVYEPEPISNQPTVGPQSAHSAPTTLDVTSTERADPPKRSSKMTDMELLAAIQDNYRKGGSF